MLRLRGDTIVEAMFSITIFSFVIVSCLSIMNQSSATAERSLEITQVRQEINAQAETLRFLNYSYIAAQISGASDNTAVESWGKIESVAKSQVSDFYSDSNTCPSLPDKSFILDATTANYVGLRSGDAGNFQSATTFSRVYQTENSKLLAEGMWIEAKSSSNNGANPKYIDFYIRACWDDPGGNSTKRKLDTVVRLYEPNN